MPRPRKCRKVCCMPINDQFGPIGDSIQVDQIITMSVDEYESIRLMDLEGCTQEECAIQMGIARTTVQGIYNEARRKLADALVNGKLLTICGGDFMLCQNIDKICGCNKNCPKKR
ncbi:DUF134 domain-containing protein [Clostridium aminobutyricum]|uniref:UPF0251 protein JYB65_08595 n=1 Tax=Clostridium aminobutyricum TaxID=33953 RepID=A0A939D8L5_CLOAM|nr:DUF134 domain-containing protein [Clostridium aminobutyricum]MBN7773419.1 DUF134 domain-containing protein [Clostridium aminobutyricum]